MLDEFIGMIYGSQERRNDAFIALRHVLEGI